MTPRPEQPTLPEQQLLDLVLQRIPSPTNHHGVAEYAGLEYLGQAELTVCLGRGTDGHPGNVRLCYHLERDVVPAFDGAPL